MSVRKLKHKKPSSRPRPIKPGARRAEVLAVAVALAVGICAAIVLLRGGALVGTGASLPSLAVAGARRG